MQSLINVSNRLPVTIAETTTLSSGGLVSALEGFQQDYDFKWVGWSGGHVADAGRRSEIAAELKQRFNFIPIFLDEKDVRDYYTGFSNSSIWPLLHYHPYYARNDNTWMEAYRRVNALFAEVVAQHSAPGDLVWVHDYHLMMLPELLRQRRPDLKIGFFLHTPFPSYEVFRCHPGRRELLQGVLGADLIGFQTSSYVRHFRSAVLRVLGIESEINVIPNETHAVTIGVYPISIPTEKFRKEMESEAYRTLLEQYRKTYAGRKVVLSVERLDYTKGVLNRLDAIERFLSRSRRQDVTFIFISVPSRESVEAYQDLRRAIELKVGQINGAFGSIGTVPVHFMHQTVSFTELCALYTLADVAAVTPLVDGMNLVAKEYVMCQKDTSGVLILSEFAGAAQELADACTVNPYDVDDIARCLEDALALPEEEKRKRLKPMRERVLRHDARRWGHSFIEDLAASRQGSGTAEQKAQDLKAEVLYEFFHSENTAVFLDYDGTLAAVESVPADAGPSGAVLEILQKLDACAGTEVYIACGRSRENMERWFSRFDFNLIAEDGFYFKHRSAQRWMEFEPHADLSWKSGVTSLLLHYADMTPGSLVEEKAASLSWHYRRVDPEFGTWKAHQLVAEMHDLMSNLPVVVGHADKRVEISSILINKGLALQHLQHRHRFNRILCASDDEADESMFRIQGDHLSIKVGPGDTSARYRVSSPTMLRRLLAQALTDCAAGPGPGR